MGAAIAGIGATGTAIGYIANQFGLLNDAQARVFNLGCTREVSSFEAVLQNWNGKYSPNGAYPISVGLDGNIYVGRGATCPLLLTCRVESVKYESSPATEGPT